MGCNGRLADFLAETAEQPIAVPQPLAYYIGYRVRKTVNVCIGYRRQLPKFFYTIPTQANNVIFYQVISMDYTNPKIGAGEGIRTLDPNLGKILNYAIRAF